MPSAFMTRALLTGFVLIACLVPKWSVADDTVLFIVRHADRLDATADSPLNDAGKQRAEQLAQTLEHLRVDAIYHTDFSRTRETARPLARRLNLEAKMQKYDVPTADWVKKVLNDQKGKRSLIVGHSNTVPDIIKELTGKQVPMIAGNEYDNLFVIVISDDETSVARLHYGKPNPSE